jgi:glycosyltransferase involved in cell wall biosynthesis
MENKKIEYSIVIPVYNSEKSLTELYNRLSNTIKNITLDYEIILVDDDSHDNSWQVMKKLREKDKKVKIIQNMRNYGQHFALMCGFRHSKGKYIITMDDDLQNPPEEIIKLINEIKKDDYYDIVIGYPIKKKHNFFRNFISSMANRMNSYFFDKSKNLRMSSFRIIKRNIIDIIITIQNPNFVIDPTLLKITRRIKNVDVKHDKRKYGKSQYNLKKIMRMSLDNILMNSTLPLRLVSILGILIAFLSFGYGFYVIFLWIFRGISIIGWTSTILSILFFSGIILISMGIIGEYLIRIIKVTNQRSQYFIREKEIE